METASKKKTLKNERLNNEMSRAEYDEKYDVTDSDTFKQQLEQLDKMEIANTVLHVLITFMEFKTYPEFARFMEQAHKESRHFKEILQEKLANQEQNGEGTSN